MYGRPPRERVRPIFFLIYVNDLPGISNNMNFTLFAGDTIVTISGENDPHNLIMILTLSMTGLFKTASP